MATLPDDCWNWPCAASRRRQGRGKPDIMFSPTGRDGWSPVRDDVLDLCTNALHVNCTRHYYWVRASDYGDGEHELYVCEPCHRHMSVLIIDEVPI